VILSFPASRCYGTISAYLSQVQSANLSVGHDKST